MIEEIMSAHSKNLSKKLELKNEQTDWRIDGRTDGQMNGRTYRLPDGRAKILTN